MGGAGVAIRGCGLVFGPSCESCPSGLLRPCASRLCCRGRGGGQDEQDLQDDRLRRASSKRGAVVDGIGFGLQISSAASGPSEVSCSSRPHPPAQAFRRAPIEFEVSLPLLGFLAWRSPCDSRTQQQSSPDRLLFAWRTFMCLRLEPRAGRILRDRGRVADQGIGRGGEC